MSTVATPSTTQQVTYDGLYARWEHGHWLSTEIDFSEDRRQWREELADDEKAAALWFFSLFFHGEDFVTDDLSPYVDAAPLEAQTYFLTTQQVDEARHSIFFKRFLHEVVGLGDGTAGSALAETASQLTWGHRTVFEHLGNVAARLRRDHSPAMFAEALFNYHVVVEGTLAQPGQHMLQEWVERRGILPGFREGMERVSTDEQRHIAFGVKALSELYAADPDGVAERIIGTMRRASHWLVDFAYPLNGDRDFVAPLGVTLPELYSSSMHALDARLKAIGMSDEHRREALPIGPDMTFEQQGERMLRMLEAGYFGSGTRPKSHAETDVREYFTVLANAMRAGSAPAGTVVQFSFTDVPPRHLVATADGDVHVVEGTHPSPSVALDVSFDDFLDVFAQRTNPVKLVLLRRLKVTGDRGLLSGARAVFGPTPPGEGLVGAARGLLGRLAG